MSEIIRSPVACRTIWQAFADVDYRHAYAEGHTSDFLASQLHALRTHRGWSQAELASKAKTTQPQICGWESSCEGVRLDTLHKLAEAFDVALVVKFVPFSALAKDAIHARADAKIPSFGEDSSEAIQFPVKTTITNVSSNTRSITIALTGADRRPRRGHSLTATASSGSRRELVRA